MDPLTDCPICFETYERWEMEAGQAGDPPRHAEKKLDCCGQSLCFHCYGHLRRCPFCRIRWHGDSEEDDDWDADNANFWQRRNFPNPILTVWGTTLALDLIRVMTSSALTGARAIAAAATAAAAESPLLLAGTATGAAVVVGGLALVKAAQHRPEQAERLQQAVRNRIRHQLVLHVADNVGNSWRKAVANIWDALHWHLSPQLAGMPHVYTGSIWRTSARMKHHAALSALLHSEGQTETPMSGESASSSSAQSSEDSFARLRVWGDVVFCFILWLDYNPHTPNWGYCSSYGLPHLHLCWHNRWREDGCLCRLCNARASFSVSLSLFLLWLRIRVFPGLAACGVRFGKTRGK